MRVIDAVKQAYEEGKESASVEYENLIEKQEITISGLKDEIALLRQKPENALRFKYACLVKENEDLVEELHKRYKKILELQKRIWEYEQQKKGSQSRERDIQDSQR